MDPKSSRPIRVLAIDDSVVVRRILARAIDVEPDLELVGVAANGQLGLQAIHNVAPDVVVLDLDMPVLDGVGTLAAIRRNDPVLPVIIFSYMPLGTVSGVMDALERGTTEFVLKPSAADGMGLAQDYVRAALIPVIRDLGRSAQLPTVAQLAGSPRAAPGASQVPAPATRVRAVVVAASTGGPEALRIFLGALPPRFPVPILIVQHMPAGFTKLLAERLDRVCALDVREGVDGGPVDAGTVWVAPGGRHLALRRSGTEVAIRLEYGPKVNYCRPSADILFRAASQVYGSGALAVVLTGMGVDGRAGSVAIHDAGGTVMAQSADSCVVASMPMAVADIADAVVPIGQIAHAVVRCVTEPGSR